MVRTKKIFSLLLLVSNIFFFFALAEADARRVKKRNEQRKTSISLPIQFFTKLGIGYNFPYGNVVVPTGHKAASAPQLNFHWQIGAMYEIFRLHHVQLYAAYQSVNLGVEYSGSVHQSKYVYQFSFLELGSGLTGYKPVFWKWNLYYEGGVFYGKQLGKPTLKIDTQKKDSSWQNDYTFRDDLGLFVGGGLKIPIPEPKKRLFFQLGLKYKIGFMAIAEGNSGLAYTNEKDSLRAMEISLQAALLYRLF